MHRIAAKFVPRVLTQGQKDSRVAICQELKETVKNDPTLLLNVITGDDSIVYAYDPETKLKSSQWKSPESPRPKKAPMKKIKLKTMLICSFEQKGIVHREFFQPGMTVNANFYCDVLRRLRGNVRRRRSQK
jgi:histone-lysine N-methyltransferase SETMAR